MVSVQRGDRMSWRKWLWIVPGMLILFAGSVLLGWGLLQIANKTDVVSVDSGTSVTQEDESFSSQIVNTPVSESILVFNKDEQTYQNGHEFISKIHNFYEETLTYGRIQTASYEEQKKMAESIIETINRFEEVDSEELKTDLTAIKALAERVSKSDDREAMRKLHRYFHDLDIYLNGYDYEQIYQITAFKGAH